MNEDENEEERMLWREKFSLTIDVGFPPYAG